MPTTLTLTVKVFALISGQRLLNGCTNFLTFFNSYFTESFKFTSVFDRQSLALFLRLECGGYL